MAFKEAERIRIRIIILDRNSDVQAVTRISDTTPVQNGNRATTRLEPANVSRRQQLLGGGIIHKHKMSLFLAVYEPASFQQNTSCLFVLCRFLRRHSRVRGRAVDETAFLGFFFF